MKAAIVPPTVGRIRLSDVFTSNVIRIGFRDRTKSGAITEMVEVLKEAGHFSEQRTSKIARAIGARERVGSTAIGKGLALPHCRTDLVDQFTGVLVIDPAGIDFSAIDGLLVYAVFLVIGPEGRHEEHFDVLARLNGLQFDKGTRLKLFGCRTAAEVAVVLRELDREW